MKPLKLTLAAACLFIAGPLLAQQSVQATVPFSFYVGNSQLMPAGTYRIAPCSANIVVVRNCNEGLAVLHVTRQSDDQNQDTGKLIFHKYGDTYFLSQVQGPTLATNLVLPVGKNEKRVKAEMTSVTTYETITVPKQEESKLPNQ